MPQDEHLDLLDSDLGKFGPTVQSAAIAATNSVSHLLSLRSCCFCASDLGPSFSGVMPTSAPRTAFAAISVISQSAMLAEVCDPSSLSIRPIVALHNLKHRHNGAQTRFIKLP